ncbi:RNA polymerase sigma (SigZ) subunit [Anaerobacterium chartisolvens]|uniref:RNA polymerase sigma factor SigZ n=1 Tax=Anaerobacterium chartisolvens TaxID=1297424 RepID=A0A369AY61_9FIRM|nr:RNA polymerase sigma factor SigZ [Anaerobacterium chartisolvens]RCX14362.1 RNA polymerase sigma (SigZ) subunit [Anaerobacterium chartisolvens]
MITSIESIWEEFNKPLKSFIQRRIKNDQDVDDILQNVFYKIHSSINSLRDTEKTHAWVYRIARNTIVDFYRAQKYEEGIIELSEDILSETDDESTANDEIAQCVKAMIEYLPESYKQAILLTEFQHLTQKELGERMGLSVSGAKSRVQRARAKLKEMLLGCCQLEFDRLGNVIDYQHKCNDCKFC